MAKIHSNEKTPHNTSKESKEPKAKKAGLCVRDKWVRVTDRLAAKITSQQARIVTCNPDIAERFHCAAEALRNASTLLATLPADWRAKTPKAAKEKVEVVEGSKVDVRDKKLEKVADLLEPAETKGLTVVKVAGSRLRVQTSTGITLLLPRNLFRPAVTA